MVKDDDINRKRSSSFDGVDDGKISVESKSCSRLKPGPIVLPCCAIPGGNQAIRAAIEAKKQSKGKKQFDVAVAADVENPTWLDFCIAIFFIAFSMLALSASLVSILLK
ncbi:hypothetical protein ACHAW5_005632 [Stephanodiscus triporus]|uniref:Uncharacterized protein n=1 Tax=Stephanodiscus triporus TaxID=2934178 RepID=A0ABD3MUI0_9STRA